MIENLKIYLVEVAAKKLLPMAVLGGITAICTLLAAHQGMLSSMGIDYDSTARTIDISLDTLSSWAIVALGGLVTALMAAVKHTTTAIVTGTPISGDMRSEDPKPIPGGGRPFDPVKPA